MPEPKPQSVEPSGGHMGTGIALTFAEAVGCAAFAMWLEARAPVATRERAKMRAKSFIMIGTFLGTSFVVVSEIGLAKPAKVTLGCYSI